MKKKVRPKAHPFVIFCKLELLDKINDKIHFLDTTLSTRMLFIYFISCWATSLDKFSLVAGQPRWISS